jgi:hypothetical protein
VSILAALVAVIVALAIGYAAGRRHRHPDKRAETIPRDAPPPATVPSPPVAPVSDASMPASGEGAAGAIAERARVIVIRSFEAETALLRRILVTRDASVMHFSDLSEDRRRI